MSSLTLAPQTTMRSTPSRRSTVKLTRRGRMVVLVVGMAVAFALGVWLAAGSTATDRGGVERVDVVTVAPGQTLWDIASDVAAATGESDVSDVMTTIQQLNSLDSSMVYAGQEIRVPTE